MVNKTPTKKEASKAGYNLQSDKTSKATKSKAGATLNQVKNSKGK